MWDRNFRSLKCLRLFTIAVLAGILMYINLKVQAKKRAERFLMTINVTSMLCKYCRLGENSKHLSPAIDYYIFFCFIACYLDSLVTIAQASVPQVSGSNVLLCKFLVAGRSLFVLWYAFGTKFHVINSQSLQEVDLVSCHSF